MFIKLKIEKENSSLFNFSLFCLVHKTHPVSKFQQKTLISKVRAERKEVFFSLFGILIAQEKKNFPSKMSLSFLSTNSDCVPGLIDSNSINLLNS